VYALGACLFTFVYGRIPFSAPSVYQLFQARGWRPPQRAHAQLRPHALLNLPARQTNRFVFMKLLRTPLHGTHAPAC